MGELDERADAVEGLEGGGDAAGGEAGGLLRRQERRVEAEARADEAHRHGLGEVGGDPLRGGAKGGGELGDL